MDAGKKVVKEWTPTEIDLLINLVRENEDVYDQTRAGYSNVNITDKCWRSIAERFSTKDEKLCKSKWQVLRGTYTAKRQEYHTSASGSAAKRTKKWAYFEGMSFLEKHMAERKTSTNITVNSPSSVEQYVLSPETGLLELESEESCTLVEEGQEESRPESFCSSRTPSRKRVHTSNVEQSFINYLDKRKPKTSIRSFLESLEEDLAKLSGKGLRRFKMEVLTTLERYVEEEENG